jgi:hypothetical protein
MRKHLNPARVRPRHRHPLARFRGEVTFFGGIDTQELLIHATPEEVRADVRRVREALGPRLVVSPSHEALLPGMQPANILAMAEEATGMPAALPATPTSS